MKTIRKYIKEKRILNEYSDKIKHHHNIKINANEIKKIMSKHDNVDLLHVFEMIDEFGIFDKEKILEHLKRFEVKDGVNIRDVFWHQQLNGKKIFIDDINSWGKNFDRILIVGGWIGQIALLIEKYAKFNYNKIKMIDLKPQFVEIANSFGVKSEVQDMFEIDYFQYGNEDLIINTSSEHIDLERWSTLLPKGINVAAQATNMEYRTHINVVHDMDQFKKQLNLSEINFLSINPFTVLEMLHRFTILGVK